MQELFMGSDVSKGYCDFVILNPELDVTLKNFQLDDTYLGHNHLKIIIDDVFCKNKDVVLYVGFESTGGYENNWFKFFTDQTEWYNIKLVRLNPKGIFHHAKSVHRNVTTDKESAKSIAEYLIHNKNNIRFNEENNDSDLKKQRTFIQLLTKQSTQLQNQLEKHLYVVHPQLLKHYKRYKPVWFLTLLSKYPTAQKLSNASVSSISRIPYISETKAKKLKEEAIKSIASSKTTISEMLIQSIAKQIINLQDMIIEQKQSFINATKSFEVELLKSFIGIGDYTASGLILSIGRIQRFSSSKKLASFFGVHPKFKQSGDKISGVHMSKEGRKEARYYLFNIVMSAINYNPWMKELYERYQKKGKSKLSAVGIIMHKITRIIFGMLKNKTEYNPSIDKFNIDRSKEKKTIPTQNRNRRFQDFDSDAPISKRHKKKRDEDVLIRELEQVESQNDNIILCEINHPPE